MRLSGRFTRAGLALSGPVSVAPGDGSAVVTATLDPSGRFDADVPRAGMYRLAGPSGRVWTIDATRVPYTVMTEWAAADSERLDLLYAGDPTMEGQTATSMAAQARAEAAAATAQAASALGTLSIVLATAQAALTAAGVAQSREIGLVVGRAPVPTLAVNVATEVAIAWAAPVVPTTAIAMLEPSGSLLGQVTALIKPGSVRTDRATVVLRSPLSLALGAGSVAAIGAYLAPAPA